MSKEIREQINKVKDLVQLLDENIKIDKDERIKLTDNEKFLLIIPLTTRASCKYGATTKWCVSGKEYNKFNYYRSECKTVGMVMVKEPEIQRKINTSKIALNVWGDYIEIHNELNRNINPYLGEFSVKYGFVNEMREVFNDFINYHNSICDNKINNDFFDKQILL
jgi:hypothetical protein